LGGSTGAQKYKDPQGNFYVLKHNNSPEHLQDEVFADTLYGMAGLAVPEFEVIDTPRGKGKLSRFLEGAQPLGNLGGAEKTEAIAQLKDGFLIDALLGNWDVIGLSQDNVMVQAGRPFRIDNGGSLRHRAQGAKKTGDQWNEYPTELWSLRAGTQGKPVFGNLTPLDLLAQEPLLLRLEGELKAKPLKDPELMATLEARIRETKKTLKTVQEMSTDGYIPEYVDKFTEKLMDFKNSGGLNHLPKELKSPVSSRTVGPGKMDFQSIAPRDEQGNYFDDLRGPNAVNAQFLKGWMEKQGGNHGALRQYQDQQGGSSWAPWPVLFKAFTETIRPAKEGRFWSRHQDTQSLKKSLATAGKHTSYSFQEAQDTFLANHVLTYALLTEVDHGQQTPEGKLRIYRTDGLRTLSRAGFTKIGDKRSWTRGPLESASLYRPESAVSGSEVTQYELYPHRVFANYIWNSESTQSAFMEDSENEITVDLGDVKAEYLGNLFGQPPTFDPTLRQESPVYHKLELSWLEDAFLSQRQQKSAPSSPSSPSSSLDASTLHDMKAKIQGGGKVKMYLGVAKKMSSLEQSQIFYEIPEMQLPMIAENKNNPGTYKIMPPTQYKKVKP
jgi:hypothetical protein